ncbi:glycosyltransferase 87 family protein [Streptomyces dysideae]|uniref:glycosyltransferase 87 family protein n=1 Tax=Streptomyces dysideae TaxID=909626 RepID=UPI000836A910|nr:glycosyltransferase 87 family protein [Streptomyces dysideae]
MGAIRIRTAVTAALLAGLTASVVAAVRVDGMLEDRGRTLLWNGIAWALFAAAAWSVRRVPVRAATALVLAGGAAVAVAGLTAPPGTSSDMYRYAWDGKVQAAGISPYDHPPVTPELARLREGWLFPPQTACQDPALVRNLELNTADGVCTRINRPTAHTIYPPVAEGWFAAVHELSPDGSRHKALQTGGAALAMGTTVALIAVLRRRGRAPHVAALWAWCPAVPVEAVNNAHVDALGVLLTVLAFGTTAGTRRGALLGAAIAVKLYPVLALPGALSGLRPRQATRVLLPAVAVIALAYLPYVLASGAGVLGYLPGYLHEEGYDSDTVRRFALLRLVLPAPAAGPAAAALLLLTALHVLRRGDPARPWSGALLVTGTALLLTSPAYSWYALLVVALVALDGRWEWLAVPAAGAVLYIGGEPWGGHVSLQSLSYGTAALAVLTGAAVRTAWRADSAFRTCCFGARREGRLTGIFPGQAQQASEDVTGQAPGFSRSEAGPAPRRTP